MPPPHILAALTWKPCVYSVFCIAQARLSQCFCPNSVLLGSCVSPSEHVYCTNKAVAEIKLVAFYVTVVYLPVFFQVPDFTDMYKKYYIN